MHNSSKQAEERNMKTSKQKNAMYIVQYSKQVARMQSTTKQAESMQNTCQQSE